MSHEIRTPLNGVIGLTEVLLDSGLEAEQRGHAELIRRSGEALLALVNDVLDFAKIDAGHLELERGSFSPALLAGDVAQILAEKARSQAIDLMVVLRGPVPLRVAGDPGRVQQVLFNLVGNALKFTESGHVLVGVRHRDGQLHLAVQDTGIGISPAAQARLFEPFAQAEAATQRHYGGTGLGLTISRRLVEAMGGELSLWSEEGRGSTFTVRLPVREVPAEPGDELRLPESAGTPGVQVCLRDRDLEAEVAGMLAALGVRPEAARPDVRLVDRERWMPGIAEGARSLIVLRDARDDEPLELPSHARTLLRPLVPLSLVRALREALGIAQAPGGANMAGEGAPERRSGRVLVVDDNAVNRLLLQRLLGRIGLRVEEAEDGIEALARLAAERFDLCFLDLRMPRLDGYGVIRELRQREQGSPGAPLPVIALTASAEEGVREACLRAGMDDYLAKPFRRDALVGLLRRWLPSGSREPGRLPPAS